MRHLAILALLPALSFAQTPDWPRWETPAGAAARENPLKGRPELAAGGKKVFLRMCAGCHEAGTTQRGRHLSIPAVQEETDGALFWKISTGNSRSGMPNFSALPDGQRWQLVLYIRTLARRREQ